MNCWISCRYPNIEKVSESWGGGFKVRFVKNWKKFIHEFEGDIIHLTMYGINANDCMDGLRAVNTGPMGQPEHFAALQRGLNGAVPLIYQEMAPLHPDRYFRRLIDGISLRGVILAPQVCDRFATGDQGGIVEVVQHRRQAAGDVLAALRRSILDHDRDRN